MQFLVKNKLVLTGVLLGSIGGYLYYRSASCTTGACPITSNPFTSILYGAMMGGLLLSLFKKEKQNNSK